MIGAGLLNGLSIGVISQLYIRLANRLTEWENHQTDVEFESAYIRKIVTLEFINNYASLFYIAFAKKYVGLLCLMISIILYV